MLLKIGIDAQALQTENSRNRGIGRYSQNLLKKIFEKDSEHFFKLVLNGLYKEKINFPINEHHEFKTIQYRVSKNTSDQKVNNLIQLLDNHNSNFDILQIMSPSEGFPSLLPVTNNYINRLNSKICTIIYDLIPLNFPDHYFSEPNFQREYFKQLKLFYHSDILFAISESTRIDAINILGINPNKVITIRGAPTENFFHIQNINENEINQIKKKYGIKKRFVLYTTGIEFRKNNEKSIKAFSKIKPELLNDVSFVLVCNINESDKSRLKRLAQECNIENNLVLTRYLPDNELNILYNCCDAFIFPSLIEGLGIPLLEAMKCEAPVIGSDTSSIAEIIGNPLFTFNPQKTEQITEIINKILLDESFKTKSIQNSKNRVKMYTWDEAASIVLSTYKKLQQQILEKKFENNFVKPKIAYFSPLPPKKSGISYYSLTLLPLLSKYWDIDLFVDDYYCEEPYLSSNFNIYSYHDFEKMNQLTPYDSILYQIGNSDNHTYMFDILKKYPGIVVLHDVYLGGLIHWMTARLGKLDEFIEEVIYSHGEQGKKLVEKAKKNIIGWDELIWNLQINKRVLDSATSVIVHSEWDEKNIIALYPEMKNKISLIHQFAPIRERHNMEKIKESLGFSSDDFLICSFGFVVYTKKIDSVIKNLKEFLQTRKNAKYLIVGELEGQYGEKIKKMIHDQNLSDQVIVTGFIEDSKYKKYLDACDVCISLRTKPRAGTSASVNHSLGAGIPTIISDIELFREFPDDIVFKVKSEDEKNLGKIIQKLYDNPNLVDEISKKAKKFAEEKLSKDTCVQKYVSIVQQTLKNHD